jgi:cation/acetate symporter
MKRISQIIGLVMALTTVAVALSPVAGYAAGDNLEANKGITITMFLVIIAVTMGIVVWAAKRTRTTTDFYAAGNVITGTQNGLAIAGDFCSAAAFLGVAGLISIFGFDGLYWCFGPMMAFVTILLLIAEPCRNLGKYTVGDILSFRASPIPVRATVAVITVTLSIMYLILQMVGAGKLMQLLLGIPYQISVAGVGIMMVVYVMFGGMIATTWVQIIKATLLMAGGFVLFVLVGVKVGFDPIRLFREAADNPSIRDWVQTALLKQASPQAGFDYGQRFLEPGLFMPNAWDQLANSIGFLLGTAGMPHILMRFFTVPDAKAARKSVVVATVLIGVFFIMCSLSGFGAALFVTPQLITKIDPGGNMANLLLAKIVGTDIIAPWAGDILMAFLCAVAFATILAVVSGVVLAGASGISHDLWVSIIRRGKADQREQLIAAKITSAIVGIGGILIAMASEKQNVAHIGVIAFGVAASGNFPAIILSLFWRKMSTAGVCAALFLGTLSAVGLVLVSPTMQYPKVIAASAQKIVTTLEKKQTDGVVLTEKEQGTLKKARDDYQKNKDQTSVTGLDKPLFPYKNPGLVSVPIGFLAAIIFSLLFPKKREQEAFDEVYVRQNTGIGIAKAIEH